MLATDSLAGSLGRARPIPRPIAWVLLATFAAGVLTIGLLTTAVILSGVQPRGLPLPVRFWGAVAFGAIVTAANLGIRTIRWIFLLRRTHVRLPIEDACIGYLSGFSLLLVPLLVGEIVVRAAVQRSRARVPVVTTSVVSLWERLLDVAALALILAAVGALVAGPSAALAALAIVALTMMRSVRRLSLAAGVALSNAVIRRASPTEPIGHVKDYARLTAHVTWLPALTASVVAWALPGAALWAVRSSFRGGFSLADAQFAYASTALTGALVLAPGGIRIVGTSLIAYLTASGLPAPEAAIAVLAVRLVTLGLATFVGVVFIWIHCRTRAASIGHIGIGDIGIAPSVSAAHFTDIAHVYDAQIPVAQRDALLTRKTALMHAALTARGIGPYGLDAGCGQGWYVARMRQLGLDVRGIDVSAGQVAVARRHVEDPGAIASVINVGTVLRIAAADASYDFVYCINVLHHLPSIEDQRSAFAELLRVLKPGGLFFVHEINTRNLLFRFYMGYVFPTLNCIDEGTERWLLPHRLQSYSAAPVVQTTYFTFMPEFVPGAVMRLVRPLERLLEASPLRVYSAHYMAVLQKPGAGRGR